MPNQGTPIQNSPVIINGSISRKDEAGMAALMPRVNGTGSVTLSGTVATSDIVSIRFASAIFPSTISIPVTCSVGETLTSLATKLCAAIMANATLRAAGLTCSVDPTVVGKINFVWPGPLGTFVTISGIASPGAEGFAYVQISGGSGPVIPIEDFQFMNNGSVVRLFYQRRIQLDAITLANLVAGGLNKTTGVFPCQ